MKKVLFILAFAFVFLGFAGTSHAASCGDIDPITNQVFACGNGPVMPQQPGGRFLKAGQEDCPSWFPNASGYACYTMRPALGVQF